MSGNRPQAAAERSEDRVRTVAKPEALDIGTCELCVDQEVALKAGGRRHAAQPDGHVSDGAWAAGHPMTHSLFLPRRAGRWPCDKRSTAAQCAA